MIYKIITYPPDYPFSGAYISLYDYFIPHKEFPKISTRPITDMTHYLYRIYLALINEI